MNEDEKMLRCPFCGSETVVALDKTRELIGCQCGKCLANVGHIFDNYASAIAAWNTRATGKRPSELAGQLNSYEKFDGTGPHAETVETRARIGESYLEAYKSALSHPLLTGYTPADCPSEMLLDLLEKASSLAEQVRVLAEVADIVLRRLDDLDWNEEFQILSRDFDGHLGPAIERLQKIVDDVRQ